MDVVTSDHLTKVGNFSLLLKLAGYPMRGNLCVCDLYEIYDNIFYYRAHTNAPPSLFDGSVAPKRDGVNAPFRRFRWRSMASHCLIKIHSRAGDSILAIVLGVFRI